MQAVFFVTPWIITQRVQTAIAEGNFRSSPWLFANIAFGVFVLIMLWPMFAVVAKRLHDVGWIASLGVAPFVVFLLGVVQGVTAALDGMDGGLPLLAPVLTCYNLALIALLACLPGTKGANRFGLPVGSPPPAASEHF